MKIELSATPTKENDVEYSNCPFLFSVIIFHPFPVLKEDTFPSLPALSKHVIIKKRKHLAYCASSGKLTS